MSSIRSVLASAVLAACAPAAVAPASPPMSFEPSGSVDDPPAPTTAAEAVVYLRTSVSLDGPRIGYFALLSPDVAAFRMILADDRAAASFQDLAAHGTPAGRLYGLAGLYFVDGPAFDAALAALAHDEAVVTTFEGCSRDEGTVAHLARGATEDRVLVERGESLDAALTARPGHAICDVAGGCIPLRLVDDNRPAPRAPVR